jgi:hypothetical protein
VLTLAMKRARWIVATMAAPPGDALLRYRDPVFTGVTVTDTVSSGPP